MLTPATLFIQFSSLRLLPPPQDEEGAQRSTTVTVMMIPWPHCCWTVWVDCCIKIHLKMWSLYLRPHTYQLPCRLVMLNKSLQSHKRTRFHEYLSQVSQKNILKSDFRDTYLDFPSSKYRKSYLCVIDVSTSKSLKWLNSLLKSVTISVFFELPADTCSIIWSDG